MDNVPATMDNSAATMDNVPATMGNLAAIHRRTREPRVIDHLPTEIVGLIFRALWRETAPHPRLDIESWPWYHPVHSSLIAITHVSRRWREIALDIPLLWSRIDTRIRARTSTFLRRSRASPIALSICISVSLRGTSGSVVHQVLDACHERLARLDVRLEAADIFTHPLLGFPAPALQVLTIQCEIYSGVDVKPHPILFTGSTANLEAMALLHVRHWLPGNHFPNLVHLNISYFFMEELPLTVLTHLLANCPRLESLHLGQVWSYALFDLDLTPPPAPVHLPNLRSLSTSCATLQTIAALISALALPSTVRIRIHDAAVQSHTTARENILPSLDFMSPLTHLELAADSASLYLLAESEHSPAAVWIQGIWQGSGSEPSIWPEWLLHLHETFHLSAVRTLHVSLRDWSPLPALLSRMSSLTALGLMALPDAAPDDGTYGHALLASLSSALGRGVPPPCPDLSTLSLQLSLAPPSVAELARMLEHRATHGCRLARLIIDRVRVLATNSLRLHVDGGPGPLLALREQDAALVRKHVGRLDVGEGGLCTWAKRKGWEVDVEHWKLPVADEPRRVVPWHTTEDE